MLGTGFARGSFLKIAASGEGVSLKRPAVALDMPGTWLARAAGEDPEAYYSDYRAQREARRKAASLLERAAGLKLTPRVDFDGAVPASVFGGSIFTDKEGRPRPEPVLESPDAVAQIAARVDSTALEEAGLMPKFFEWRRRLQLEGHAPVISVLRIPGPATVARQLCGPLHFAEWTASHPAQMSELAGVITRTLLRLIKLARFTTRRLNPGIIFDDPAMGDIKAEEFHEVYWRATRALVFSAASFSASRCYLSPNAGIEHAALLGRLKPAMMQVHDSAPIMSLRNMAGKSALLGHVWPQTLESDSPEDVKSAAESCLESARSARMPLILSACGPVGPATPPENIAAMTEVASRR